MLGLVVGSITTLAVGGLSALACVSLSTVAGPRAANYSDVAEAAALIASPLATPDQRSRLPDRAEFLAAFQTQIEKAERVAKGRTELAPIAQEFAATLREFHALIQQGVDFRPVLRHGFDAFQGYRSDDNWALWSGLFGVGMELYDFSAKADQVSMLHSRMVACRLRLVEAAARTNVSATSSMRFEYGFQEVGVDTGATEDRFVLKNVSGGPLTNVLLVTELHGRTGETFSNCYYAERWADGEVLYAPCASSYPFRETVRYVTLARLRLFANEGTTEIGELKR